MGSPYFKICERRSHSRYLFTCDRELAIVVGVFEAIELVVGLVCDRRGLGFVRGDRCFDTLTAQLKSARL